MKLFSISIIILLCTCCSNEIKNNIKIEHAVEKELHLHPKARLIDLYKNFFQDTFGPGHIISDSLSALEYLNYELLNSEITDTSFIQHLGYNQNYVRVSLHFVKTGEIPEKEYFDLFLKSANEASTPTLEEWKKEWNDILIVIEKMNLDIHYFIKDKNYINECLEKGYPALHHSDDFRNTYNPHYRIISTQYFNILERHLKK